MDLAAFGALLTGLAGLISSLSALRVLKRHANEECDRRVREALGALREGIRIGHTHGKGANLT